MTETKQLVEFIDAPEVRSKRRDGFLYSATILFPIRGDEEYGECWIPRCSTRPAETLEECRKLCKDEVPFLRCGERIVIRRWFLFIPEFLWDIDPEKHGVSESVERLKSIAVDESELGGWKLDHDWKEEYRVDEERKRRKRRKSGRKEPTLAVPSAP